MKFQRTNESCYTYRGELRNRGLLCHGGLVRLKKAGEIRFWEHGGADIRRLRLGSESFRIRKGKGPTHAINPCELFQVGFFLIWAVHRPAHVRHETIQKRNTPPDCHPLGFSLAPTQKRKSFFSRTQPELACSQQKATRIVVRHTYQRQGIRPARRQCGILKGPLSRLP